MPRRLGPFKRITHTTVEIAPPDPDQQMLERVGEQLYGVGWQTRLAKDLGVNRRSIERWKFGVFPITAELWGDVRAMLRRKQQECLELELAVAEHAEHRKAAA